jgi:predicted nucleotidyltransferase
MAGPPAEAGEPPARIPWGLLLGAQARAAAGRENRPVTASEPGAYVYGLSSAFSLSVKTIADMPLQDRDRQAIEKAVHLLRERFPIDRVVLYGSKARGSDTPESDVDLLLLTKRALSWQERNAITDALFDIELEHDVVISTLTVPSSEWQEGVYAVLPIHDEIERHGVGV